MAKEDFSTIFRNHRRNWSLLGKLSDGPIKDNLIEIQNHLAGIDSVMDVLSPLINFGKATDAETITLAIETFETLICMIDSNVDGVFYHLNEIFEPKPQAAAKGGEA